MRIAQVNELGRRRENQKKTKASIVSDTGFVF
jgi:hypothetical protein